jgi:plasmid stabilization system protein ParE
MEVRWLSKSAADMEHISNYLWENAPAAAERVMQSLYDGVESLAQMPHRGRPYRSGMRQLPLLDWNYLVTYKVVAETVQILRVRHMARKPL